MEEVSITFLNALIFIILFPFLVLIFCFYIIPRVTIEMIISLIHGEEEQQ